MPFVQLERAPLFTISNFANTTENDISLNLPRKSILQSFRYLNSGFISGNNGIISTDEDPSLRNRKLCNDKCTWRSYKTKHILFFTVQNYKARS